MSDGGARAFHLAWATLTAQLPRSLDEQENAVHTRMTVGKPTTVGIHWKWSAWRGTLPADERAALAASTETQRLQREQDRDRKRVVDLNHIDFGRSETGHSEGCLPRGNGSLVRGQIGHIRDRIVGMRLPVPKNPDRGLARFPGSFGRRDHHSAAAVGHKATVQQVQRLGNPARIEYIFNSDWIAHHCFLVH